VCGGLISEMYEHLFMGWVKIIIYGCFFLGKLEKVCWHQVFLCIISSKLMISRLFLTLGNSVS